MTVEKPMATTPTDDSNTRGTLRAPAMAPWLIALALLSIGVIVATPRLSQLVSSRTQLVALVAATLAVLWAAGGTLYVALAGEREPAVQKAGLFRSVALFAAVVPAVLEIYLLVVRVVLASLDLTYGDTIFAAHVRQFSTDGLWVLFGLLIATILCLIASRNRSLATVIFWQLAAIIVWMLLLLPGYRSSPELGIERAGTSVYVVMAFAGLLWLTIVVTRAIDRNQRWTCAIQSPDRLIVDTLDWPGLNRSGTAIQLALILLAVFHLAVPVRIPGWSHSGTMVLIGVACLLAAVAGFLRVSRVYTRGLAETSVALVSLSFASIAVATVPATTKPLVEHYPSIFAALIVGLCAAALMWAWVYGVWQQQLDDGRPWTPAGFMIPITSRFSFFSAATGL
ncbi:MAG: hypothetical protein ACPGXK_16520, partial [Phycisphaerae bacterium]